MCSGSLAKVTSGPIPRAPAAKAATKNGSLQESRQIPGPRVARPGSGASVALRPLTPVQAKEGALAYPPKWTRVMAICRAVDPSLKDKGSGKGFSLFIFAPHPQLACRR